MSTLEDGQNVGRYRVLRFLGAGAMGEVYLAEDPHIERKLAIKTVRLAGSRPQDIEDRKRRLLREARAAGRMLHPNIVTLFDAGEFEGLLYLAFEFVEGADLASRIETPPPLNLGEVLRIIGQVADALDYAHRQGIVHRDIKPSNILLDTTGKVKVADFGIAKVVGQNTELTVAGSVMGSPQYLAPEQIRGEELDGRSDVFSLGVVLYELLSGHRPFDGDTITTLVYQILNKEPSLSTLRAVPPRLEQLLHHMMAKDREQRIASAAMVAEELSAIARELPESVLMAPAAEAPETLDATRILPSRASALPADSVAAAASASAPVRAATDLVPPPATSPGILPPPGTSVIPPPPAAVSGAAAVPPPPVPMAPASFAPAPPVPTASGRSRIPWLALAAVLLVVLVAVAGSAYWAWVHYIQPMMANRSEAAAATSASGESGASGPSSSTGAAEAPSPAPGPTGASGSESSPIPTTTGSTGPSSTASSAIAPPSSPPANPPSTVPAPVPSGPASVPSTPVEARPSPPPHRPVATPDVVETRPARGSSSLPVPRSPAGRAPSAETDRQPVAAPAPEDRRAAPEAAPDRVMKSGLLLSFRITPPDSIVLLDGTVIGRAEEWNGEKDHHPYELPGPGSYAIKIKHSGMENLQVMVEASATRGVTPLAAQLKLLPAENLDIGDLRTVRVRQGIALSVEPDTALVQVDGQQRGMARQYPGHFGRASELLLLEPGRHRVTLTLPGYRRYDFAVEVYAGAERDHEEVKVVLLRGAAG